ncbi:hypothetical protein JCM11251_005109 [Rhodosporidiobolus azoricus]
MGVPKLWDELEPSVRITTWTQLSEPGYAEAAGTRGLRLGIDLSAWIFHMQRLVTIIDSDGVPINTGKNSDIRVVFYRLCQLLSHGILPIFIFDGPYRPSFKRGHRVGGSAYGGRSPQTLKTMFECLGAEWREAPGEAEAELAAMNRRGEIDCILSDDVDTFLFGAERVIRNMSKTLSSNKSKTTMARTASAGVSASQPSQSQPSSSPFASQATLAPLPVDPSYKEAVPSYSAFDIHSETGLGQDELILVALLAGGDYLAEGCRNFGNTISVALAKAGYAKTLLDGVRRVWASSSDAGMSTFLDQWRLSVADELRTNRNKLFRTKHMKLATELEAATDFPSLSIVDFYLNPRVSSPIPGERDYAPPPSFDKQIDLPLTAAFCQRTFNWGNHECEARFRSILWRALGMQALRREALKQDGVALPPLPADSALPPGWIGSVVDYQCRPSTDYNPSYRVALNPSAFNPLIISALPSPPNDPHPLPDYSTLTLDEEAAERARRKAEGALQEPMKEPETGSFRKWIGQGWAAVEGTELERKVREMWQERARKAQEAEEKEEAKKERARLKALGLKSPRKKKAESASPVKVKGKGRRIASPGTSASEGEEEGQASDDVRQEIEKEKIRRAREALLPSRKGKEKAVQQDPSVARTWARTKSYLDESEEDNLDDLFGLPVRPKASAKTGTRATKKETAPDVVQLSSSPGPLDDFFASSATATSASRRPVKTAANSTLTASFPIIKKGALNSMFGVSKPSLAISSSSKPKPPSANPFAEDDPFGLSPPPPSSSLPFKTSKPTSSSSSWKRAKPLSSSLSLDVDSSPPPAQGKHAASSPPFSSTSEDEGQTKRKVGHVKKAGRGSREETSPRKTRPAATSGKPQVVDLCESSAEEEEPILASKSRARLTKREGETEEKGKVGGAESLSAMWARRQALHETKQSGVIVVSDSE